LKLSYRDNKFIFETDYTNHKIPKKCGFSYNSKLGVWFTGDVYKALILRRYADDELNKLFDQFLSYLNRKIEESEAEKPIDNSIEFIKPNNGKEYYPFQKAGIEYGIKYDNILLADEMGLGKSIQAIGIINSLKMNKVLIICPNTLKTNWKIELKEWLAEDIPITISNSQDFEIGEGITIVNYEAFNQNTTRNSPKYSEPKRGGKYNSTERIIRSIKKQKKLDCIILDESHRIKNYTSNTTRNIFKIRKYFKKKILMTGSPLLNRPEELWTTIKFLGYQEKFGRTKKNFGLRYCDLQMTNWGWDYSGASNLDELQMKLRETFMIRRKRQQVLKDLPTKFRKPVFIEIDEAYKKFLDEYDTIVTDVSSLTTNNIEYNKSILSGLRIRNIEDITEIRKIVGQAKILPVYEYTKEILDSGEKVVLFGHHTDVLNAYKRKFGKYNPAFITGSVKQEFRHDEVQRFQNDDTCRIIILNLDVGSVGLTLTASHNVVFAEIGYVPLLMNQAEDRCNRIGSVNNSTNHYILANETLDAIIGKKIIEKQNIFDQTMETEKL